jgi:hypothetical protein
MKLIKAVCLRASETLGGICEVCDEVLESNAQPSLLGKREGEGLYLYIKMNEAKMKSEFPAFDDGEILRILLAQWHQFSEV